MADQLALELSNFEARAVSPLKELGAYEALWDDEQASFKTLSEKFRAEPCMLPSDFVPESKALEYAKHVRERFQKVLNTAFGVRVHGAGEYPMKLRAAAHPIEFLYFQGWWDLVASPSVAVVGSRKPSREGLIRTRKLVKRLVEDDFTIVSGLAMGIDTEAHKTTIKEGGRTIAVIGTPLSHFYPRGNKDLQHFLAKEYLVISQVPLHRYERQDYRRNRFFFPERNITMSALTEATVIVEASDTSGTLVQARAALQQGRKLFILDNCFRNTELTWPQKYVARGAIRVVDYDDIRKYLSKTSDQNR